MHVESLTRDQRARLRRRYLGFVFQGFNLLARTSAQENVELPLFYRGEPAAARHAAAAKALDSVGLKGWEHHTPAELSGGQQQRVAIARAIVTEPAVLLADEPTGNLDTQRSREIMELLWRLNVDHGITVLMVTHEADMAAYARRIVRFVDGVVADDTLNPHPAGWTSPPRLRPRRGGRLMLLNTLLLALRSIRRNLLRSFLTMLGIVIGVSAVITMVTLGNGATLAVQNQISSLGTNLLQVRPGQRMMGPGGGGGAPSFKEVDADAIASADRRHRGGGARGAHRRHRGGQRPQLGQQRHRQHQRLADTGNWKLDEGRDFHDDEQRAGAAVCVIGETVRRELFGSTERRGRAAARQSRSPARWSACWPPRARAPLATTRTTWC